MSYVIMLLLSDYIDVYLYVMTVYVLSKLHCSGPFREGKMVGCTYWHQTILSTLTF